MEHLGSNYLHGVEAAARFHPGQAIENLDAKKKRPKKRRLYVGVCFQK